MERNEGIGVARVQDTCLGNLNPQKMFVPGRFRSQHQFHAIVSKIPLLHRQIVRREQVA